jgi:hypothetical protein
LRFVEREEHRLKPVPPKTKRLAVGGAQYITNKLYHSDSYIRNLESGSNLPDEAPTIAKGKSKKQAALEKAKSKSSKFVKGGSRAAGGFSKHSY